MKTLPEGAWDQGLMSRTFLIYSKDRPLNEDVFASNSTHSKDLAHDLQCIYALAGQFRIAQDYRDAYNGWRKGGCEPTPAHPRLLSYCARRGAHLLKLSMVASVDTGDSLLLELQHFDRALAWLVEAEKIMPDTFDSASSVDSRAIEEIIFWIGDRTVSEFQIVRFASERMPISQIQNTIKLLTGANVIRCIGSKDGINMYRRKT